MSDRRIKLTRIGILMLIGIAASCLVIFVVIPSYLLASSAATVSAGVHDAKSVTFSEFIPSLDTAASEVTRRERILHSVEASPEQVSRFDTATGGFFGFGSPLSHTRCFDPHHRVEVVKKRRHAVPP